MECFQPVGSFKIRGVGRLCRQYVKDGRTHLVSSSGGNAGYAVAYAGHRLNVKVTVFVPETTSTDVASRIESLGAAVKTHGRVLDETDEEARRFQKETGAAYVPPFDHPTIWAGHATVIEEAVTQCPKPDAVVVSVGGGGLMCGVLAGMHANGWGDVPVIAAETKGTHSLAATIQAGKLVKLDHITSIATSLGAKRVSAEAFAWTKKHEIIPHVVTDQEAVQACQSFADDHRVLVEPACGAALTAVYNKTAVIKRFNSVLVIVCGGIGVTIDKLRSWQHQL